MTASAELRLFDMHCHLDFAQDAQSLAAGLGEAGIACFSATVTPTGYERCLEDMGSFDGVRVALGLHPWWIADGRCTDEDVARFETLARDAAFIGEVGLDFGGPRGDVDDDAVAAREAQRAAFERVAVACAAQGGKVVSVHAVKSCEVVLDLLEQAGSLRDNAFMLHWFSGTSDELQRAVRLGCFFSIGSKMLATKRGREYAKAVPRNRLLLETDMPPAQHVPCFSREVDLALQQALDELALARGEDRDELGCLMAESSRALLRL